MATAVHYQLLEAPMLRRTYFLHYHLIQEMATIAAGIGLATLLSYLILQAHL